MSPDQMRAARALLNLSQADVCESVGITRASLSNAESGKSRLEPDNYDRLRLFFISKGLEFTDYNGVRETPSGLRVYKGNSGFREFYEDQFKVIQAEGGDLWLYNGVSELVMNGLGKDYVEMHKNRMSKIKDRFTYRVIVEEGDATMFGSDYAHYRWVPKDQFNNKTIFVYGPYVALVNFESELTVTCIHQREFADTMRQLMLNSWDRAEEPNVNP